MKSFIAVLIFSLLIFSNIMAQDEVKEMSKEEMAIPYYEIPAAPENYDAAGVTARMIDGLGFRFYWASKDLTETDLEYQASETSRTTLETLEHVYGLSKTILNGISQKPNIRGGAPKEELEYKALRKQTLENLKAASDILRKEGANVEDMKVVFQRGEKTSEFPFWNLVNGPIEDAIWHAGQLVYNRRASGNPLAPGVSVFSGKKKN
ncbi:MAG: hypothetical protein ACJAT4_003163 [Granulosicoccus sp.]|jgi:hypothetical protein